jgi:hypothetical protein
MKWVGLGGILNRWTLLSFVIYLFTVFASPLAFEGAEQLAGTAGMPTNSPLPEESRLADALMDNRRMTDAFAAKIAELGEGIRHTESELTRQQAMQFDLDQKLTAQQGRAGQPGVTPEDLADEEARITQSTELARLQAQVSGQQQRVAEVENWVQQGIAANVDTDELRYSRALLQQESQKLANAVAQYKSLEIQVGLGQRQQLQRSLERVMSEKAGTQQLEQQKLKVDGEVERLQNELGALHDEQARTQEKLRDLESEGLDLEQSGTQG